MASIRSVAHGWRHEIDKIKGSRFLAAVEPITSADAALAVVEQRRDELPESNHHGFAWRLRAPDAMRYSDDGEPSGTAGRPILREIDGRGLVDVVVVVSRIFGGTKLGTGGLIRAYGGAASAALDRAPIVEQPLVEKLTLTFDYQLSGPVQGVLAAYDLTPTASDYGAEVRFELAVPIDQVDDVRRALLDATQGRGELRPGLQHM